MDWAVVSIILVAWAVNPFRYWFSHAIVEVLEFIHFRGDILQAAYGTY